MENDLTQKDLHEELEEFFQGSMGQKVKTLNMLLNRFMIDGEKPDYIPGVVYEVTTVIDFLITMKEKWEVYKELHDNK